MSHNQINVNSFEYRDGWQSYLDGYSSNPYPAGSEDYANWQEGYDDGLQYELENG